MILQCAVIFAFLAAGEFIVALTGIPIPSSIVGMLLLTASLKMRLIRVMWVDKVSDFLVKNLGFFFVPAGVGLMRCLGIISEQWLPIIGSALISTFVIIAVTGWVHQLVRRSFASHHEFSR
ncbi:MAG: CidA/LrgA family protein [Muribaculaceae bacterium]|nr:CidA/LrgA family protein [Muribaculaceae bacterium]